jgi:protocatechuate 3,4-dioxygenase beta subunit
MGRTSRWLAATTAAVLGALSLAGTAHADTVPSLAGTVTDRQTGAAVPGACVTVVLADDGSTKAEACSDAAGRYEVPVLPADNYKIRIHAAGYAEQWAYDKPDFLNAQSFWLSGDFATQVDVRLRVGSGTVGGRITNEDGSASDSTVTVERTDEYWSAIAYTDAAGNYRLANVPPGPYRVSISDNVHPIQWAHGKESQDAATVFTVVDGGTTVVDESYLPLATVTVTVTDEKTGKPVPGACAIVVANQQPRACAGTNGVVTVPGVAPGTWSVSVYDADGAHWPTDVAGVDVVRGGPNRVSVALRPATSVITTLRDARTKRPVSACAILAFPDGHGITAHPGQFCSDPTTGRLVVGPLDPATFQLFVNPQDATHGALWVGTDGGTGDQRKARVVTTRKLGQAGTLPPIDVGPAGTISGVVRDRSTGAPVGHVCAYPYAFNPLAGSTFGANCTSGADGRYTISGLGPYEWPVEFTIAPFYGDYAWQWSGNVSDRLDAKPVRVRPGGTATLDAQLKPGGTVSGTVTDRAGQPVFGYLRVYNADTGDFAAWGQTTAFDPAGSFTVKGIATQKVKVEYLVNGEPASCWYLDKTSFRTATPVPVKAGAAVPPVRLVDCNG